MARRYSSQHYRALVVVWRPQLMTVNDPCSLDAFSPASSRTPNASGGVSHQREGVSAPLTSLVGIDFPPSVRFLLATTGLRPSQVEIAQQRAYPGVVPRSERHETLHPY